MQVLILCGGRGTRLNGERPKPLIEIGGRPILWHAMSIYAAQGFDDFLLLTGYQGDAIERWARTAPWRVECVETGVDTPTGGRVHAVRDRLDAPFHLTYADGVADIDLAALLAQHGDSGALATMTVVRPELPFGVAMLDGDRVAGFAEKPPAQQ
jgi:glucose-1-phosphate cytidylyltransferase